MFSVGLKCGVMLSLIIIVTGCVTVPKKQAFNKAQATGLKTITVAVRGDETRYDLEMMSHPASIWIGGAIGGAIAQEDVATKAIKLTQTLDRSKTRLRQTFASELERRLAQDGYQIRRVPFADSLSFTEATANAVAANSADAVLVALMSFGGYTAPGPTMDYEPEIAIESKLVARDGRILFEDRVTYGFRRVASTAIHLTAPESHKFKDADALFANPEKTRAVLIDGARKVAEQLALELKR